MGAVSRLCLHGMLLEVQVLSLKGDGIQFPKNPNALPVEQYCGQHFFGPLVIALQTETAPPALKSFTPDFLEKLVEINSEEGNIYPPPPIPPLLSNPSFLPSLESSNLRTHELPSDRGLKPTKEVLLIRMSELLTHSLSNAKDLPFQSRVETFLRTIDPVIFFVYRYKTAYCANKSKDHDWNTCIYAHKPFDYRRPPDSTYYLPEKCKYFNSEMGTGCNDQC